MKRQLSKLLKCYPYLGMLLFPLLHFYLLESYTHDPFKTMKATPLMMNAVLFWLIALFLFALIGRLHMALMLENVFCMIYGLAGYFVLEFRGAPIQPWDLLSLSTAASVADNYEYRLDQTAWTVLLSFLFLLVLEFFCRAGFSWTRASKKPLLANEKKTSGRQAAANMGKAVRAISCIRPWQVRLALGCISALLLFGYTTMLHNEVIVTQKLKLYDKLFTPTTIQFKNGTLTAFLMELQYISVDKPEGYHPDKARELLTAYTQEADPDTPPGVSEKRPNIIVIMNEAFSDPAVLGDFSTNKDYMPFVHSLMEGADNTVSGDLVVSVKGGNTANTEFEFLTGSSMAFLPYGSIPYQQYIKEAHPTVVSHLAGLGYHTIAMHPYRAGGWDRDTVYPDFGFAKLHFEEFFKDSPLVRKYVSDRGNYEKIIQLYENKPDGQPLFLFNVTMQNHSSYSDWADYDNFTPDITVEDSNSKLLPAYLSLMHLSDQAIEELLAYFDQQEEETLVVFFGDHQPTDSVVNPILKLQGRSTADLTQEEEALRYHVPFFIWANYDIPEENGLTISSNYLAMKTLQAAGLPMPAYFSYLETLYEKAPVISASHVLTTDGGFSEVKAQKELLNDYQTLQYYLLFDRKPEN